MSEMFNSALEIDCCPNEEKEKQYEFIYDNLSRFANKRKSNRMKEINYCKTKRLSLYHHRG